MTVPLYAKDATRKPPSPRRDAAVTSRAYGDRGCIFQRARASRTEASLDVGFVSFGRSGTHDDGTVWCESIKPGIVPFDGERMQAPHISVMVFARGLLNHLAMRLYFAGEAASDDDPLLQVVTAALRATLLARRETTEAAGARCLCRFDIVLQGAGEAVFFNL